MTSLSDFPPDVTAAAKDATERWFFSTEADLEVIIAEVVMADRAARSGPQFPVSLTAKQRELLTMIAAYQTVHRTSPTFGEMRDALGLNSVSGVHRLIRGLQERGAIQRLPRRARAITIIATPNIGA